MSIPTSDVKRIEFGLLSPDEIRKYSVAEIKYAEPFENHKPKYNGLSDPRMGCLDRNVRCLTCNQDMNDCPGHFGHIELSRPVYHISYIEKIKKVLECICTRCARVRIHRKDSYYNKLLSMQSPKNRFNSVWKYCKGKVACEYSDCGHQALPVRRDGANLYVGRRRARARASTTTDDNTHARRPISPAEVRLILSRISNDDCTLMGFHPAKARPEWMILTVLPVPPPCVRPSVSMGTGGRGEDDLTYKLGEIIRYNQSILKTENDTSNTSLALYEEQLQYHLSVYLDNETSLYATCSQKGGRPIKSVSSRLGGKSGRIRSHLMGKRVDHTARTVITGDANLGIEELGVPKEIASNLTFAERVTQFNLDHMQELVDAGPNNYPGASYVVRSNGNKIDLSFAKTKPKLTIGDTVERHLRNGDTVLFNRQPTLHKMSMMAHKVRVMPGKTFRLNLSVTTPYNADFDGDEMNTHLAQNLEAMAELNTLSRVSQLVVSAQANKPVMGIVQDALCGVRKFTMRDTFLTRQRLYDLLLKLPKWNGQVPPPSILKPEPLWTGKQLFSMLLPDSLNYSGYHSTHPDGETSWATVGDTKVIIQNGQLLSGIICKKAVGPSQGGLIHIIWQDYGPDVVRDFFDGCQFVVNEWLLHHGFSVGLGDCVVDKATQSQIDETVQTSLDKVTQLIQQYKFSDDLENQISTTLSRARDASGKIATTSLPSNNNFKQMVYAGSKGSVINISQIAATVGQQNVEGGRVPFGFRNRSLPYFAQFDNRAEAKGFVKSSYIKGLNPTEFFFHAMGGREGLIDTACKTAETGYIQRRLVKAMEDVVVAYDSTVRTSNGFVLQFLYGEDGMDGTLVERQNVDLILMDNESICTKLSDIPQEQAQLQSDRDYLRKIKSTLDTTMQMPVHIRRLVDRAKNMVVGTPMQPLQVYQRVSNFVSSLKAYPLFEILVRYFLASKTITKYYKLDQLALDWTLNEIRRRFNRGKVDPGEGVGIVAAQSIGEPTTQMTLNSVTGDTEIVVWIDKTKIGKGQWMERIEIGKFVDDYIDWPGAKLEQHPNDTTLSYISDNYTVKVLSCDEDGKLTWRKIEAVTRHPVINKDGSDTLLKVVLKSGRKVIATKAKSFLTRQNNKILPLEGDRLKVGDYLPVSRRNEYPLQLTELTHRDYHNMFDGFSTFLPSISLDADFGWVYGTLLGSDAILPEVQVSSQDIADRLIEWSEKMGFRVHQQSMVPGVFDKPWLILQWSPHWQSLLNHLQCWKRGRADKRIEFRLMQGPDDFVTALLVGLYEMTKSRLGYNFESASNELLIDVSQLLLRFGIRSKLDCVNARQRYSLQVIDVHRFRQLIGEPAKGQDLWEDKEEDVVPNTVLSGNRQFNLLRRQILEMTAEPGLSKDDKEILVQTLQMDIYFDEIVEITQVPSNGKKVYDLTVEGTRNFSAYNGIALRDTFHFSGINNKAVTLGVPRLKELINTVKNIKTPSMTIHLDEPYCLSREGAMEVARRIQHTTLQDIVAKSEIVFDPDPLNCVVESDRHWSRLYWSIPECVVDVAALSPWMLRLVLRRDKMMELNLTVLQLRKVVEQTFEGDLICIGSDDNAEELAMHIRFENEETNVADSVSGDAFLQQVEFQVLDQLRVKGVSGVESVLVQEGKKVVLMDDGKYEEVSEWYLETFGINMQDTLCIEGVDGKRMYCNDPMDIVSMLGIEAARECLLREIRHVIEYDGSYVNYRHLALLCDVMTNRGQIMSITRHGINRLDSGPLKKCTFEETQDVLIDAALNAEIDNLQGVSENILMGKMIPTGTGLFDVVYNDNQPLNCMS